jgi:hypothetical protein
MIFMASRRKIPSVRIAKPNGRPIQLRYTDPATGKEIRISTGTTDEAAAIEQKKDLEAKLRLGQDAKPSRKAKGGPAMGRLSPAVQQDSPIRPKERRGRQREVGRR